MPSGVACPATRFPNQAIKSSIMKILENVKEYPS